MNTLYTGDCLFILHGLDSKSVDMIYLDPPFNSKRIYSASVGSEAAGSSFDDMWTWKDVDQQYLESIILNFPYLVQFIQAIGKIHGNGMKSYITYMTQRIIEMERVLKDNGSFYLHCDSTASHYLKIICDRVFSKRRYKNEINWKRTSSHALGGKHFAKVSDKILFYASNNATWNRQFLPHDESYIKKNFRFEDNRGVYRKQPLHGGKSGGKEAYKEWKGALPPSGRAWAPPTPKSFPNDIKFPKNYKDLSILEKLNVLDKLDLVTWNSKGNPDYKYYLSATKGKPLTDLMFDINPLSSSSPENTGYPTQKPLELIRRLILSSTNEEDIVLDPFCGTATTCVAAQQLQRKWIGIDIEKNSARVVMDRLSNDAGLFSDFMHTDKFPKRSDIKEEKIGKNLKEKLYKDHKGKCNACETKMEIRHFEIDHIIPRSKNGADTFENFQLLCGSCNRIKGDRPMEYLMMRIEQINKELKYKVSF